MNVRTPRARSARSAAAVCGGEPDSSGITDCVSVIALPGMLPLDCAPELCRGAVQHQLVVAHRHEAHAVLHPEARRRRVRDPDSDRDIALLGTIHDLSNRLANLGMVELPRQPQ